MCGRRARPHNCGPRGDDSRPEAAPRCRGRGAEAGTGPVDRAADAPADGERPIGAATGNYGFYFADAVVEAVVYMMGVAASPALAGSLSGAGNAGFFTFE